MEDFLAKYIFDYYSRYMTLTEAKALKHYMTNYKYRESIENDKSGENEKFLLEKKWLTDDVDAINLLKDGFDSFQKQIAERIFSEHSEEIFFNNCPKCGQLARTPLAKQCRFCKCDWHDKD